MDFLLPSLAFIEGLGGPEMVLILVVVLVLFGGDKLPDFARGLGKSIREFKKAASGVEEEFKRALEEDAQKKSTPALPPVTYPAYPPVANLAEPPTSEPVAPAASDYTDLAEVPATTPPAEVVSTDATPAEAVSTGTPTAEPATPAATTEAEPEKPAKKPVSPPEPSAESYAPRSADLLP